MTDLLSLVLTLRPARPAPPPPYLGRAAHALALDAVQFTDPALGQAIHAGSGPRPFTASSLIGPWQKGLHPDQTFYLRLTALTAPVASALLRAAEPGALLGPGASLQLSESAFTVVRADFGPANPPDSAGQAQAHPAAHPWAGATTYEALSAPWLLGRRAPAHYILLRFASPTTFKSAERYVPVPLPQWVWGSLLEKWNAFAPVALPPEARRFAEECLALTAYELRTRMVSLKEGGLRPGAVGLARYTALNRDRYWLSVVQLLADFAFFAGVGVGVAMGLGQCRREIAREPAPESPADPPA